MHLLSAKIEVEVENLDMVKEAVEAGADIIMLDNMSTEQLKESIDYIAGRAEIEVSGNVTKRKHCQTYRFGCKLCIKRCPYPFRTDYGFIYEKSLSGGVASTTSGNCSPRISHKNQQTGDEKMKGEERRTKLLDILSSSNSPISGGTLSKKLDVSRQIIVQDISLLRANGATIFSTNKGYLLQEEKKYSRVFKVYHFRRSGRRRAEYYRGRRWTDP